VALESPLPTSLPAGTTTALYCSGTAWEGDRPVDGLTLIAGDACEPAGWVAMPRFDVPHRRSGWWAVVPVRMPADGRAVVIEAEVCSMAGSPVARVVLGAIESSPARPQPAGEVDPATAMIAICMATFEPDESLFRAQLDSIRAQTDTRWTCVISDDFSDPQAYSRIEKIVGDDPRFHVSRAPNRIGFYRNFERAVSLAPPEAALVALSDQDDAWDADKLATLRTAIGGAPLVYSDMRLVDEAGQVLRATLWEGRANNRTNMASMIVANTITGAAMLMRREVVERALPFPDTPGIDFHDHWIALVALALGTPEYVGRPLYDYVQHRRAILGRVSGAAPRPRHRWLRRPQLRRWRAAWYLGYVPGVVWARTLLERCSDTLSPRRRRALERYLASASSPRAFAWFAARPARLLVGRSETRGGEWDVAVGIGWAWLARGVARLPGVPDRLLLDTRFPDPPHFEHTRLRRWRERI
jgi:hypothetical protein